MVPRPANPVAREPLQIKGTYVHLARMDVSVKMESKESRLDLIVLPKLEYVRYVKRAISALMGRKSHARKGNSRTPEPPAAPHVLMANTHQVLLHLAVKHVRLDHFVEVERNSLVLQVHSQL